MTEQELREVFETLHNPDDMPAFNLFEAGHDAGQKDIDLLNIQLESATNISTLKDEALDRAWKRIAELEAKLKEAKMPTHLVYGGRIERHEDAVRLVAAAADADGPPIFPLESFVKVRGVFGVLGIGQNMFYKLDTFDTYDEALAKSQELKGGV